MSRFPALGTPRPVTGHDSNTVGQTRFSGLLLRGFSLLQLTAICAHRIRVFTLPRGFRAVDTELGVTVRDRFQSWWRAIRSKSCTPLTGKSILAMARAGGAGARGLYYPLRIFSKSMPHAEAWSADSRPVDGLPDGRPVVTY
jgi:hypothetical protein